MLSAHRKHPGECIKLETDAADKEGTPSYPTRLAAAALVSFQWVWPSAWSWSEGALKQEVTRKADGNSKDTHQSARSPTLTEFGKDGGF